MNSGLPGYDNWLEPDDEEDEGIDKRDSDEDEPDSDDEHGWGRRVENGRMIYEEDFIYDPLRN